MHHGLYESVLALFSSSISVEKLIDSRNIDPEELPRVLSIAYQKSICQALAQDPQSQAQLIDQLNALLGLPARPDPVAPIQELLALSDDHTSFTHLKDNRPKTSIADSTLFIGNKGHSLVSELKREILTADEIVFLVSFIKYSGLRLIYDELERFTESRPLRVITTSYMSASDFKAIQKLAALPNTQIKISYDTKQTRLHAKAYIFKRHSGFSTAYIGSSNISSPALTSGLEWNLKISEYTSKDVFVTISKAFDDYWHDENFKLYRGDKEDIVLLKNALTIEKADTDTSTPTFFDLQPYAHQKAILEDLAVEREEFNSYKNLVVAATGTGKTMVAAFDYRNVRKEGPATLLFIAHRKEILEQSLHTFRHVLRDANFGDLFVDGQEPQDRRHLFASVQTLLSQDRYEKIPATYYDYVVIDESHHIAASSYKKLLNHFTPKILLGLTATPERMDGEDITVFFNQRIASELRLNEAIDANLLAPFHYFAVSDAEDLSHLTWTRGGYDIAQLENVYTKSDQRVQLVLDSMDRYITDIPTMKCLGFCVSVAHAEFMAARFNQANIPSLALHGQSPKSLRDSARQALQDGRISCIFTVDLFNEGIDIPEIDTILFLRPTESITVFLQQLGRGLRLSENKDALTVLDYIGQAHQEYDFSFKYRALIGKTKRPLRKEIEDNFPNLPMGCHIQMERLAKSYVLKNITSGDINARNLEKLIKNFAFHFDKALTLANFLDAYEIDKEAFYSRYQFYALCHKVGLKDDYRVDHAALFKHSLRRMAAVNSKQLLAFAKRYLLSDFSVATLSQKEYRLLNMLYYTIWNDAQKESYQDSFSNLKHQNPSIYQEILDIIDYNAKHIHVLERPYQADIPLDIHAAYTKDQLLAAFDKSDNQKKHPWREGVLYIKERNTDLFLITINKMEEDYLPTTMYKDYAINKSLFHWESQSHTAIESPTGQRYISKDPNHTVLLFARSHKKRMGQPPPYIFLGPAKYVSHRGSKPIEMVWKMQVDIPEIILNDEELKAVR